MNTSCACTNLSKNKDLYADAVKSNLLTLISSKSESYMEVAELTCNKCNRNWIFTRDDSYHHPIIEWEKKK